MLGERKRASSRRLNVLRNSLANIMTLRGAILVYVKHEIFRRSKQDDEFQTISLGCLRKSNLLRRFCIRFVSSIWFDRFITLCVLLNTILLGFVDYSDPWVEGPNPTKLANRIIDTANTISLLIFISEGVLKVIAQGFLWGKDSYLSEGWNRLDFLIILSGMLSWVKGTSKIGSIRVLRVLRPLRTLHSLPGLKVLTTALLASLPALGNVAILLAFIYLVFAILGMELWRGSFGYRCRVTPFPVALNFDASNTSSLGAYPPDPNYLAAVIANPWLYPCLDENLNQIPVNTTWSRPLNCFWPVDTHEVNPALCSPTPSAGRQCGGNLTCGSNYDLFGNPRFLNVIVNGTIAMSISQYDTFNSKLNYGFTSFDNVWSAFVVILQTVTASGWMALTQMTQQMGGHIGAALYFNGLLFIGMCFLLQLNMAVLYSEFVKAKEEQHKLAQGKRRSSAIVRYIHVATVKHIQLTMSSYSSSFHPETKKRLKLVQQFVRRIVRTPFFHHLGLLVTVFNIAALASDHHPFDPDFSYYTQMLNFVFLIYFALELVLKVIGHGLSGFWADGFNRFDLVTVVLGFLEIAVSPPAILNGTKQTSTTGIFTALRAARAIKLARAWKSLHKLLIAIGAAMGEILNFLFFLVLFLFVTSLLGMELFATKFQFDINNYPVPFNNTNPTARLHRCNFDSIEWALFTVFQVLTYDNFPSVLYDGWLVAGWFAPLYISFIIVIGVWIVMNMFSAILVESVLVDSEENTLPVDASVFDSDISDKESSGGIVQISNEKAAPKIPSRRMRALRRAFRRFFHHAHETYSQRNSTIDSIPAVPLSGKSLGLFGPTNPIRRLCVFLLTRREYTWGVTAAIATSCICTAFDSPLIDRTSGVGLVLDRLNTVFAILFGAEMIITIIAKGLIFDKDAYVRDPWRVLDGFIVFVSVIPLFVSKAGALQSLRALRTCRALRPLRVINKLPQLKIVVNVLFKCIPEIGRALLFFFFILFMFGIMSVMLFKGAISTCSISPYNYGLSAETTPPPWFPSSYTGDYVSNLETVDVMTYPIPWIAMTPDQQSALAPVWNTTGCGPFRDDYTPTSKEICLCYESVNQTTWTSLVPQRFDNIFESVGALYEITTMEGWSNVAIATIDSVGPDMQPIQNNRPIFMVYWWIFMIVCAFFTTNLFIGVLCESFVRENYGALVTEEQVQWVKMQRRVMALSPHVLYPEPKHPWRRRIFHLVNQQCFENIMTFATILNTALMAAHTQDESALVMTVLNDLFMFLSAVYVVESALKLAAFGTFYFREMRNQLDFLIAILTWLDVGLTTFGHIDLGLADTLIRVARVARTLRLIRQTKALKNLFDTLIVSLPAVANVTSLLLLFYYIYAAVAVQLYATVALNDDMLTEDQNFQTFWLALQTLIGFSTGENWDNFIWQVYDTVPSTNPTCANRDFNASMCGFNNSQGCIPLDGCGSWTIVPFLYSFFLFLGYIGINLFSGIVVDAIGDSTVTCPVNAHTLAEFADMWASFDPRATGLITADQLTDLLVALPPPFGFSGLSGYTRKRVVTVIGDLNIPIYDDNFVHFKDVPRALVQRIMGEGKIDKMREIDRTMDALGVNKQFDDLWKKNRGSKAADDLRTRSLSPSSIYMAKFLVARCVRRYRARKAAALLAASTLDPTGKTQETPPTLVTPVSTAGPPAENIDETTETNRENPVRVPRVRRSVAGSRVLLLEPLPSATKVRKMSHTAVVPIQASEREGGD
ncbi:hypothetical protein AC1031_007692 [Aphanomyces cochlioides]|nr:hypothetical protein AC1031_007692 [Aphanomyces cochlioides]